MVRVRLQEIKETLDLGLELVGALAGGNPEYVAGRLDELGPLVTSLLGSPLCGETTAYQCTAALAGTLPEPLRAHREAVSAALKVVETAAQEGRDPTREDAVVQAVQALAETVANVRQALPAPTYHFVFPVVRACAFNGAPLRGT